MNREEAIKIIAAKFPTQTVNSRDYLNGGVKEIVWTPERRLDSKIDLFEPTLDGLKKGAGGIDVGLDQFFINSVEHDYKNEHGLWP
jgi:hypothetical protein